MGLSRLAAPWVLFFLLGQLSCGGETNGRAPEESGRGTGGSAAATSGTGGLIISGSGAGGQATSTGGANGQLSSAGAAGVGGASGPLCPIEDAIDAPSLSDRCVPTDRSIDPVFTCEIDPCPITRALYLDCRGQALADELSATADGAILLSFNTLITIGASESRVDDVLELDDSRVPLALARDDSGALWLFGRLDPGIVAAVHETEAGWKSSTVVVDDSNLADWLDASMVDDTLGYLAYAGWADRLPHLVTWDGSCWTDELLAPTRMAGMVVETDAEKQPWVAWAVWDDAGSHSVFLRRPGGETETPLTNVPGPEGSLVPLRVLPGGLDGMGSLPLVAARGTDGIRTATYASTTDPGWSARVISESAAGTTSTDCPPMPPATHAPQACSGLPETCSAERAGNEPNAKFGLARTESGATFAAWAGYWAQGFYAFESVQILGGEMPEYQCVARETSGTGTAELVLARLTESEPTLTRFRFDMGGYETGNDVLMAARGETLLVVASLSGGGGSRRTYLEIDTTQLP